MNRTVARCILVVSISTALLVLLTAAAWAAPEPVGAREAERALAVKQTYEAAGALYDQAKFDSAAKMFSKISDDPGYGKMAKLMAELCRRSKKMRADAISSLQNEIESAGWDEDETRLKDAEQRLAKLYCKYRDWDSAIALYQAMIEQHPDDASAITYDQAICYLDKGDARQALELLRGIATDYAGTAKGDEALVAVPLCLLKESKLMEAADYLDKLWEDRPDLRPDILMRRCDLYWSYRPDQIANITLLCQQLIADYPDSPHVARAQAKLVDFELSQLKDLAQAKEILKDYVTRYPHFPRTIILATDVAMIAYHQGNYTEAIKLFEEGSKYPDTSNYRPFFLYFIGDSYFHLGEHLKVKETWDSLMKLYPDDCWAKLAAEHYLSRTQAPAGPALEVRQK